jgi:pyruvate/2-oxoglutarate dehydrogenase complex dihydrolipoamide acyltransferase (E2) component
MLRRSLPSYTPLRRYLKKIVAMSMGSSTFAHPNLRLLRMPSLSPTMKSGRINKLYLREGVGVTSYDLGFEITTTGLTMTETAEESTMDIEVIEDMFVAKIFTKEGEVLNVDSPIAVLCDSEEDVAPVAQMLSAEAIPLVSIYPAMWQAYTKSKDDKGNCGC